jgi:hypothetical protein
MVARFNNYISRNFTQSCTSVRNISYYSNLTEQQPFVFIKFNAKSYINKGKLS